jgi:MFS family permease
MGRTVGIHAESWRWAFYLVVTPGLALGICSLFMKEPKRGQADLGLGVEVEPRKAQWRDYGTLLRTPSFVLCTLGMTAMTFAIGGIAFWMPYYLKKQPGAPGRVTEIFGAIIVVAGLSATLLGGLAGDRLRARIPGSYFLVSGIAMLVGFPFMLLTLHAAFPWTWVWLFVACFCLFFNTGPTNTILANVAHPSIRATGFALNILVIHALGDVLSPVVIGILGDRYNLTFAFSTVGGTFVLAAIFWFAGMRFLARDTERAPFRLAAAPTRTIARPCNDC